ncbi:hypothetical protein IC229_26230 [Spirosoma sp. BT702]|uniref:Outer membrane protein beta-barrel domain-containing protein n=1 Tax=Spirosoma profusum TaxID=2771354 RepID=A0A926Y068_9BACT|nr:hypothetical protein [Spirosoma profusum]MBD2704169.1 hypothetical protein [Spirosoma profusum]
MKYLLIVLLTALSMTAKSQPYKGFHLQLGGGIALPNGNNSKNGYLISVEPKLGLNKTFDVYLRYEAATMVRGFQGRPGTYFSEEAQTIQSIMATGNCTITNPAGLRPFVGVGLGIFFVPAVSVGNGGGYWTYGFDNSGIYLGAMIRAGLKAGRIVLGADYNFIPDSQSSLIASTGGAGSASLALVNTYLAIKLGIDIGGKKQ